MGRTNRVRQKETQKKSKLIRKRVVATALLVITLIFFPIQKLTSPLHKSPTPEPTRATIEQKKANKALAKKIAWAGYGWKDKEWVCLDKIFYKEAKYDHLAKNQAGSSAFGIGQRLKEKSKDPMTQLLHTYKYIQHRHRTPCAAWKFHLRHNFY